MNVYIELLLKIATYLNSINDEKAIDLLQSLYPDRVVEPIYAREILLGGGNIHCITQQVPAIK